MNLYSKGMCQKYPEGGLTLNLGRVDDILTKNGWGKRNIKSLHPLTEKQILKWVGETKH